MKSLHIKKDTSSSFHSKQSAASSKVEGDSKCSNNFCIKANSRLVDVVMRNERLLLIIERFGISLGFGDQTVDEVCRAYGLNTSLVLLVMNVFTHHTYAVGEELTADMLPGLIEYLKRGHQYYLNEKLPFISELIDCFIKNTENPDTHLLKSFFKEYANEVKEHMFLEDSLVFPYIQALYDYSLGKKTDEDLLSYRIDDFEEHHSNIEEKLEDLTYLMIKHFPPTKDRFYRNTILLELFNLQYDLNDHGGIEDKLLTPMVRKLELKITGNG